MTRTLPSSAQVGAYRTAHGWRFDRPMKEPGAVYAHTQPDDEGRPIELFVPDERELDWQGYGRCVLAVADTLSAFEGRPPESVLADMLAVGVTPPPPGAIEKPSSLVG